MISPQRVFLIVNDGPPRVVLGAMIRRIASCEPAITHASPSQTTFGPVEANQPIAVRLLERFNMVRSLAASARRVPKGLRPLADSCAA